MSGSKLWEALDLLRKDGWHQGSARSDDGKRCAVNALMKVHGINTNYTRSYQLDQRALQRVIAEQFPERSDGWTSVIQFNDHPSTIWDEIETTFVKAAIKQESEEMDSGHFLRTETASARW